MTSNVKDEIAQAEDMWKAIRDETGLELSFDQKKVLAMFQQELRNDSRSFNQTIALLDETKAFIPAPKQGTDELKDPFSLSSVQKALEAVGDEPTAEPTVQDNYDALQDMFPNYARQNLWIKPKAWKGTLLVFRSRPQNSDPNSAFHEDGTWVSTVKCVKKFLQANGEKITSFALCHAFPFITDDGQQNFSRLLTNFKGDLAKSNLWLHSVITLLKPTKIIAFGNDAGQIVRWLGGGEMPLKTAFSQKADFRQKIHFTDGNQHNGAIQTIPYAIVTGNIALTQEEQLKQWGSAFGLASASSPPAASI